MKRIFILLSLCLTNYYLFGQSVSMTKDEARTNQIKSIVFKQWKFTPEFYYYSWYKESLDLGLFTIKWDEPGLGVHDNGPGGIGGGDDYVNGDKRNIYQLTPMKASTELSESEWKKSHESEEVMYNQEMKKLVDRTVDTEYLLKKEDLDFCKQIIGQEMGKFADNGISLATAEPLYAEYDRLLKNIEIIQGSHLENAKRREAYQSIQEELEGLSKMCFSVNKLYKSTNDAKLSISKNK